MSRKTKALRTLMARLQNKEKWKFIIYTISKSIVTISSPFYVQAVLRFISQKRETKEILLISAIYFIFVAILEILSIQVERRTYTKFNGIRRDYLVEHYSDTMKLPYSDFEDEEKMNDIYAKLSLLSSNDDGVEGVLHQLFEIGWKIISALILYMILLLTNNSLIIILCFGISYLRFVVINHEKEIELNFADTVFAFKRKLVYFTYDTSDITYGKEKRIYRFSNNLKKLYRKLLKDFLEVLLNIHAKKRLYYIFDAILSILFYTLSLYIFYRRFSITKDTNLALIFIMVTFLCYTIQQEIINSIAFIKKNLQLIDEQLFITNIKNAELEKTEIDKFKSLEFQNVSFKYNGSEKYAIKNISFRIKDGDKFSILGLNGAGKSTIIKLILNMYQPTEGKILINGININSISQKSIIKLFSYAQQEEQPVSIRLGEYIAGGEKNCTAQKINYAIKRAGLFEKIMASKYGLDTPLTKYLDEDGLEMSGGEFQRLRFARLLCKDTADVYIMDEPTSAMDVQSEYEFYNTISNADNKTVILVSHRMKTTEFCNMILIMKDGKAIELGDRQQLLINKGLYYQMSQLEKGGENG